MQNSIENILFPQIELEKVLKSGNRGCVYLVRNTDSRKRFIYRVFTGSAEVYRKLLGVNCRHLPKILDVSEAEGSVHVLEEYIQGDTLAFLLEGGTLSPGIATQIIIELCRALEVLHGIGAVHRDIKPENIIIRGSEAVLIDFDASRLFKEERTTDTKIMGTTGYAAPEQYGFSQTDSRTDIYSLGILLNEMLTGQHPSRVLSEGRYRPIIQKCTQINANQRYASVTELTAAITAQPKGQKVIVRVLSVLLLACILLLGGGLLYRSRPQEQTQGEIEAQSKTKTQDESQIQTEPTILPMEKPTKDPTQAQPEPVSINRWEGSAEGCATTFYYDLDGDGVQEQYLFGVDFLASPHENVVYQEICGTGPDEYHSRDIHSCVWRVNSDGSMEVEEEFTALLTDCQSNIWLVDGPGLPEPKPVRATYKWPGAINITFAPTQDSTWLYTVSAYLDNQELTAQATFRYIPRESFS